MNKSNSLFEMRTFLILWAGQSFSALGSAMTAYALVIWSYQQQGSALVTALLMVCSYAPYVLLSIFAGALSDRWNKKATMLICDTVAAIMSAIVLVLLEAHILQIWHIYIINAVSGLMNSVQQPASEVAVTKVLPPHYYQKVGGLRYLSNSLSSILTPIVTTAILGFWGIRAVILFDLFTFAAAALSMLFFVPIPEDSRMEGAKESFLETVRSGLEWLRQEQGIFALILFLAAINLTASMYNAAFPAMMLSREGGSEAVMGTVNAVIGITTLIGSLLASTLKAPKSRVRVICNCLLFSMSTENLLLALGRNVWVWSLGGFLGWILIPLMSTNLEAILRSRIPVHLQGRVFSVRNCFQFFTIPVGYLVGGLCVDVVFEPLMAAQSVGLLTAVFGNGKGSGAALFFFVIEFAGIGICLFFRNLKQIWALEN